MLRRPQEYTMVMSSTPCDFSEMEHSRQSFWCFLLHENSRYTLIYAQTKVVHRFGKDAEHKLLAYKWHGGQAGLTAWPGYL